MNLIRKSLNILLKEGFYVFITYLNIWIKRRKFIRFCIQKDWRKASVIGEKLIKLLPEKIEYYQYLALSYKNLGKNDMASSILFQGIQKITSPELLMKKIESINFLDDMIRSQFKYMGGEQNLGCFEHIQNNNDEVKKYITKISPLSNFEQEREFYYQIYKNFEKIRVITPEIISIIEQKSENLALITMEKIDGIEPNLSRNILKEVINASKVINSIKYSGIRNLITPPDFNREFKLVDKNYPNQPIFALHSFISIHRKHTNQRLFQLVYKRMKELKYTSTTFDFIQHLEKLIFDSEVFNQINPDFDYTLQHGDFNNHNMILDGNRNKLYIIDWGNMCIGPKWIDLAGLFGQLKLPFNDISKLFLNNKEEIIDLKPNEKILFLYALIVTWLIVFSSKELEGNLDLYLRPAINEIEFTIKGNMKRLVVDL